MPGVPPNALPNLKRVIKGLFKRGKNNNVEQKQGKASLAPTTTQPEKQDASKPSAKEPQHSVESTSVIAPAGGVATISTEQKSPASAPKNEPLGGRPIAPNMNTVSATESQSNAPVATGLHSSTSLSSPLAKAEVADSELDIATQPPAPHVQPDSVQDTVVAGSSDSTGPETATERIPSSIHTLKQDDATNKLTPAAPTTIEKPAPEAPLVETKDAKKELEEDAEKAPTTVPAVTSSHAPGMSATSGPLEDYMPKEDVE